MELSVNELQKEKKAGKKLRNPFAAPDSEQEPRCGMFGWTPSCLQWFATINVLMFCFVGLGIFEGTAGAFGGSVLPSIERRFGFSSAKFATVKSMRDISMILAALVIGHYGGAGHRPHWISAGNVLLGIAMLIYASPEFLFPITDTPASVSSGPSTVKAQKALKVPSEEMCLPQPVIRYSNSTTNGLSSTCNADGSDPDVGSTKPLIVFGVADFLMGLGGTTSIILGLPYVDDNVPVGRTPFYFTLSFVGKMFGPLVGEGLAALLNTVYFDLSVPHFDQTDPRWISAWYLGYIICGLGICVFGITIGCFPAVLPAPKNASSPTDDKAPKKLGHNHYGKRTQPPVKIVDLPRNLKRLILNPIYMAKLGSQLLEGLAMASYAGFSMKFIQNQYQLSPSYASIVGGIPPIFAHFVGIIIGSVIIKRFNFLPRHVSIMTIVAALVTSICYFSVLAMNCSPPVVVGLPADLASVTQTTAANQTSLVDARRCDTRLGCGCHTLTMTPVCDLATNITYVSPCFAGCASVRFQNHTKIYENCQCVSHPTSDPTFPAENDTRLYGGIQQVISGLCPSVCSVLPYIAVMCVGKFFMGIPMSGILMVQFRVVDYDLKSLATAMTAVVLALLAFLPAPIIAGYIIDSTCRFWQTSACGTQGACLLYDVDGFRVKLHAVVGVFKLLAAALDVLVTYKLWRLSFDRDEKLPHEKVSLRRKSIPVTYRSQPSADSLKDDSDSPEPGAAPGELNWDATVSFGEPGTNSTTPAPMPAWPKQTTLQKRVSFPLETHD